MWLNKDTNKLSAIFGDIATFKLNGQNMAKCYKCENDLTTVNETDEHIILNACGGRLKSKELFCKTCNSQFGETFDKELAKQINDLANLLLIKRHRGKSQSIKGKLQSSGEDYYLQYDGKLIMTKPIISEGVDGKKIQLSITAKDEKEMRQILQGLKRRYPELDVEQSLKTAKYRNEYLDEPIHFQSTIGGKEVFKSITKYAINFFIYKRGDRKYITHLFPYLDGSQDLEIVWIHFPDEIIYSPPDNEVSHIIRLIGNPTGKILYAYIELFNIHNFIVKLNDNYDGKVIDELYAFDLLDIKELVRSIPLSYTRGQLLDLLTDKDGKPFEKVQRRYTRVISIAMKRQSSHHNQELISRAINNSLGKHPDGIPITQEMLDELLKEMMKERTPMILHQFKRTDKNNEE